jgi:hypothetical protein
MKLTTFFGVLVVASFIGIAIYFLGPLLFQKTYEGRIYYNITDETNFEGKGFYITGSTVGSFELESGDFLLVEEFGNPCGSACLQYHYALLIDQETSELADAAKVTIVNPTRLEAPYGGTFSVSIGVVKNLLYDPENSIGYWELEIILKKGF